MTFELETIKALLGIDLEDKSQDTNLLFAMENVKSIILNYCNVSYLPEGLYTTACRMVLDLYRNENYGQAEYTGSSVSAIKEGDISVNFAGGSYIDSAFSASLLKDYQSQLNCFRRLRW